MRVHQATLALALMFSLTTSAQKQPAVNTSSSAAEWWRNAVIYEIYPRSFQDSNGDGIGDLNGITQRLDYLQQFGVDAIWLTPIFPSPQADFGYDISDYTAIDRQYGTMADFDRLVAEAKKRNIRVIMDLMLNHTSDKHPWFIESASSRTNAKRDWYIWRDGRQGADGKLAPPNNWVNRIEQTAWRFDPSTKQFNYHYFAAEQPDLNWRNPEVKKAVFEAARFWLDRGAAGYRLDAINTLFEDAALRDEPQVPGTNEYGEPSLSQVYQRNLPEVHDVLRDLRSMTDRYTDHRVLIGEIYTRSTPEISAWYGKEKPELQLPMDTNVGFLNRLDAATFRKLLDGAENTLGSGNTPLFVFDNHDRPRSWDRYGDGQHNLPIAKMIAAILLTTRATALVYQGQELGMETVTPQRKEDVRDPRGLAGWPQEKGRDGERTPMQWSADRNAGFSSAAKTWLPVEASFAKKNVKTEQSEPESLLNWYLQLMRLRKASLSMRTGRTVYLDHDAEKSLVWLRKRGGEEAIIVTCNMSAEPQTLHLGPRLKTLGFNSASIKPTLSSLPGATHERGVDLVLQPFETLIGEVVKH